MFCHARTRINMRRRLKATASSSAPQATAATALKNASEASRNARTSSMRLTIAPALAGGRYEALGRVVSRSSIRSLSRW